MTAISTDQQVSDTNLAMLTTDLSQHLALITGATGGIGKATCLALAALGCSIAVHYNSAADDAAELVQQLEAKGVKAKAFQADMGIYQDVRFEVEFDFGNFRRLLRGYLHPISDSSPSPNRHISSMPPNASVHR